MGFQVAYVPIGVGTFHLESAQIEFEKSIKLLSSLTEEGVYPEKMLLTLGDLQQFLDGIQPDLIVLQNITFANAAYASEVLKKFSCPIVLWTLREPVIDGGRLLLNSLTGASPQPMPSRHSVRTVSLSTSSVLRRKRRLLLRLELPSVRPR